MIRRDQITLIKADLKVTGFSVHHAITEEHCFYDFDFWLDDGGKLRSNALQTSTD